MKFAEVKMITIMKLMEVKVDRFTISKESMNEVENILKLEGKDADELTAIRNTIVKTFDDMAHDAREENDYNTFDKVRIHMSSIVAVIDNKLFEIGAIY